jgi:transposase InsO family protein
MDAYSKWLKIVVMKNITTRTTLEKLQGIFTTHGLPEIVVSDNGPTFISKEFGQFTARNGIRH